MDGAPTISQQKAVFRESHQPFPGAPSSSEAQLVQKMETSALHWSQRPVWPGVESKQLRLTKEHKLADHFMDELHFGSQNPTEHTGQVRVELVYGECMQGGTTWLSSAEHQERLLRHHRHCLCRRFCKLVTPYSWLWDSRVPSSVDSEAGHRQSRPAQKTACVFVPSGWKKLAPGSVVTSETPRSALAWSSQRPIS